MLRIKRKKTRWVGTHLKTCNKLPYKRSSLPTQEGGGGGGGGQQDMTLSKNIIQD